MMKGLIIDSCSETLLVVAINGENIAVRTSIAGGKKHNSLLLPFVDEVLEELNIAIKDIEYIAAVVGAGSFTGIRLGVTTANGLAFATGAQRVAMNAFESLAYNSSNGLLIAIDAKHGNYYGAEYSDGKEIAIGNYTNEDLDNYEGEVLVWDGVHNIHNIIECVRRKINNGEFVDAFVPMYLKKSQAERELECKAN